MNIYGRSGSGKTTVACTFPKPLLLVGSEDGTNSVYNMKGVDFVRLESSMEAMEIAKSFPTMNYSTLVLDSATSLQDMILAELLNMDEAPVQRSWQMASRETWSQCGLQTKEILRAFLGCDAHVVITALEREFGTGEEAHDLIIPSVMSALTPSVAGWLGPACDYVCQTYIRERIVATEKKTGDKTRVIRRAEGVEYCLRTAPSPVFTSKFRRPKSKKAMPECIVDPDFEKVMALLG